MQRYYFLRTQPNKMHKKRQFAHIRPVLCNFKSQKKKINGQDCTLFGKKLYLCSSNKSTTLKLYKMRIHRNLLTILLLVVTTIVANAQDFATGLVRVKSKRTSWYLTTDTKGAATTTAKNLQKLGQVWILEPYGEGYYIRSANPGEYLQAD